MFEGVIFDWDGTLAETRRAVVASFREVLADRQIRVEAGFIEKRMGTSAREMFREILRTSKLDFNEVIVEQLVEKRIKAEIGLSSEVKLSQLPMAEAIGL